MWIKNSLAACAMVLAMANSAAAITVAESGDAGQTALTAQSALGATQINGSLIDLGGSAADIDFYEIYIVDPDSFSVTMTSTLSSDNDTELFLYNAALDVVLSDDDGGGGLRSQFNAGELAGEPVGFYYLALTLYSATASAGGLITVNPAPFQTGPYTLTLTGTATPPAVPLPAGGLLLLAGLGGLAILRRRKTHSA